MPCSECPQRQSNVSCTNSCSIIKPRSAGTTAPDLERNSARSPAVTASGCPARRRSSVMRSISSGGTCSNASLNDSGSRQSSPALSHIVSPPCPLVHHMAAGQVLCLSPQYRRHTKTPADHSLPELLIPYSQFAPMFYYRYGHIPVTPRTGVFLFAACLIMRYNYTDKRIRR